MAETITIITKGEGMEDIELKNPENWYDFELTDHFSQEKFNSWVDVAREAARILEAEDDSPIRHLLSTICAASAYKGFECGTCGKLIRPVFGKWSSCKECIDKELTEENHAE